MADLKKTLNEYFSAPSRNEVYLNISEIFRTGSDDEEIRHSMNEKWSELNDEEIPSTDLSNVLNRVHRKINRLQGAHKNERRLLPCYLKIAAGIMLPLLIASVWLTYNFYHEQKKLTETWSQIVAPGGGRVNFRLSDGTTGWLNGYSELSFPLHFGKERLVKISGEAYFDVIHDDKKPFLVDIPAFRVKVLGTRFSVTAFKNDPASEVVLEAGKVEVLNKKKNNLLTLNPNRHLIIDNRTGDYAIEKSMPGILCHGKTGFLFSATN